LIGSCVFFAFATLTACFQPLTAAGDEVVAHMEELFSSLKRRIGWRPPAQPIHLLEIAYQDDHEPRELMWFGAVFGLEQIPKSLMPRLLQRFQKPPQSSNSSSGAGCGGGGCGGGCGGCSG
jgi:hypothetical protein